MTDNTTSNTGSHAGDESTSLTRRKALSAIGTVGSALTGTALLTGSAAATHRHKLRVVSREGTTHWSAAFSADAGVKQIRNADGAYDYKGITYHETGERLFHVTGYTRNGVDVFTYRGDRCDLRYLELHYNTGSEPRFVLDGSRIEPFGSWYTASPKRRNCPIG